MEATSTLEPDARAISPEQTATENVPSGTSIEALTTFEIENPILLGAGKDINIVPHPSLFPKMGQVGYAIEEALAELVDNSVDARRENTVRIIVNFGGIGLISGAQYLDVIDYGVGMTEQQAHDALVLGMSNKTEQQIGKFGMGMKTACTSLGGRFKIETTTAEDEEATVIVYDEAEFIKRGEWTLKSYRKQKSFENGTRIRIERLKVNLKGHGRGAQKGNTPIDRTRKMIAHQHRIALANGWVQIEVEGVPLEPHQPEWDAQFKPVLIPIDEPLRDGGPYIRGLVGVATDLNSKGTEYGFDLVRHGRVVKEYQKIGFSPHAMRRNIYGVIHLDEFPVTNNKTNFIRDTDDWVLFEERMKEKIKPIERAVDRWYQQAEDGTPAPGSKLVPDDIKAKYVLARDGDSVKWVLDGYELARGADGEPQLTADGKYYRFTPIEMKPLIPDAVPDQPDDSMDFPDVEAAATEGDGAQSETEAINEPEVDTNGQFHLGAASKPEADFQAPGDYQQSGNNSAKQSPSGDADTILSLTKAPSATADDAAKAAPAQNGAKAISMRVDLDDPDFEGEFDGIAFRHRVADDGRAGRHQTSFLTEGEKEVLEVVTNSGHSSFPLDAPARAYCYRRNVAGAVAERMVAAGILPCEEQISMESVLLDEFFAA